MRLDGEGVASGAMTYRTRDFVEVRRGKLVLTKGSLIIDSEVASDDLTLDVTSRWRTFPAKGAKLPQILEGVSGSFAHWKPATSVEVELPPAEISDVGVVGRLLPVNLGFAVTSGTGTLSARIAVDADRQASGQLEGILSSEIRVGV